MGPPSLWTSPSHWGPKSSLPSLSCFSWVFLSLQWEKWLMQIGKGPIQDNQENSWGEMRREQRFLVMPWPLRLGNKVKRQILQKFNNIYHVNYFKKQLTMLWISISSLVHASLDIGTLCIWMTHTRDAYSALLLRVRGQWEEAGTGGLSKVPFFGKSGTECLAASLVTIQRLAPSHPSELRMTGDLISGWCRAGDFWLNKSVPRAG